MIRSASFKEKIFSVLRRGKGVGQGSEPSVSLKLVAFRIEQEMGQVASRTTDIVQQYYQTYSSGNGFTLGQDPSIPKEEIGNLIFFDLVFVIRIDLAFLFAERLSKKRRDICKEILETER